MTRLILRHVTSLAQSVGSHVELANEQQQEVEFPDEKLDVPAGEVEGRKLSILTNKYWEFRKNTELKVGKGNAEVLWKFTRKTALKPWYGE